MNEPTNNRKLKLNVNAKRRKTIYKFIKNKNNGTVPCYICGKHVKEGNATLEHIIPLSKGGTEEMSNLSISHYQCNNARGSDEDFNWEIEEK